MVCWQVARRVIFGPKIDLDIGRHTDQAARICGPNQRQFAHKKRHVWHHLALFVKRIRANQIIPTGSENVRRYPLLPPPWTPWCAWEVRGSGTQRQTVGVVQWLSGIVERRIHRVSGKFCDCSLFLAPSTAESIASQPNTLGIESVSQRTLFEIRCGQFEAHLYALVLIVWRNETTASLEAGVSMIIPRQACLFVQQSPT